MQRVTESGCNIVQSHNCTLKRRSFHILVQAPKVKKMITINTFNKFWICRISNGFLQDKKSNRMREKTYMNQAIISPMFLFQKTFYITFGSSGKALCWQIGQLSIAQGRTHSETRKSHTNLNDCFGSNGGSLKV